MSVTNRIRLEGAARSALTRFAPGALAVGAAVVLPATAAAYMADPPGRTGLDWQLARLALLWLVALAVGHTAARLVLNAVGRGSAPSRRDAMAGLAAAAGLLAALMALPTLAPLGRVLLAGALGAAATLALHASTSSPAGRATPNGASARPSR